MLTDYFVLITGSSSGIGRTIALTANAYGANVIISGRSYEKLVSVKDEATQKDKVFIEPYDLTQDIEENKNWILHLSEKYCKINSLILSAGFHVTNKFMDESFDASFSLFNTNYFSQMELCKGFMSRKCYSEKNPSIVWISSITSLMGTKGIVSYSATKGAINSAVRSIAVEVIKKKIRVNAVLPGIVKTPMIEKETLIFTQEALQQLKNEYPLGLGEPIDIAEFVCFLISEKSKWITGQTYVIDGGRSLL